MLNVQRTCIYLCKFHQKVVEVVSYLSGSKDSPQSRERGRERGGEGESEKEREREGEGEREREGGGW